MFDILITGGTVVNAEVRTQAEVAIAGGIVSALLPPGERAPARRVVDASGLLLLPGLVDAHAHLREPGLTHKEDFDSGTRAAALGGVTTVLVMPTDEPWTASADELASKESLARNRVHVDVGFQVAVTHDGMDLEAVEELGPVSFELFTADVPERFLFETTDAVSQALRRLSSRRAVVGVSPGDQSILVGSARRDLSGDVAAFLASRPPLAEAGGIARAVLAATASGARIHVRQVNSALGLATWSRLSGLADATVETTPQSLFFTADDYRAHGARLKASPPLRDRVDVEALRQGLRDGSIDVVATDHAPHSVADKAAGYASFADVPGGMPGLQTLLQVMLTLVGEGVIEHADIVRLCSRNPANRFGLGLRKGAIASGYDADVLVLDPRIPDSISPREQVTRAGYTPFAGLSVPGRLTRVFVRGREIVRHGVLVESATGAIVRHHGGMC